MPSRNIIHLAAAPLLHRTVGAPSPLEVGEPMIIVSLLTAAPPKHRVEGVCFEWGDIAPPEQASALQDYRLWILLLILSVAACWIVFR